MEVVYELKFARILKLGEELHLQFLKDEKWILIAREINSTERFMHLYVEANLYSIGMTHQTLGLREKQ